MSNPHSTARSSWARHSRRTSSMSAWSQTSLTVRGNPPSPSSSDGAWVIGPHRKRSCSAFRVSWTPTSSPLNREADSRAHGAGTISEALVPIPGQPKTYPGRADFDRRLHMACGEVKPGPDLEYSYTDPTGHSVPARTYYLTWCDDPRPDAIRILRWENPGATRTAAG